jgi:uncharacterized protein (TIGR03437 family)
VYPIPFLARLSADGSSLTGTRLADGLTTRTNSLTLQSAVLSGNGKGLVLLGSSMANLDLAEPPARLACITDAANFAPLSQLAPGQLVALFGTNIGPRPAVATVPSSGVVPSAVGNMTVTFGGIRAPILYASGGQINVQAPYEIAPRPTVQVQISNGALVASRDYAVTTIQPSAFVRPEWSACLGSIVEAEQAVALNGDGTVNSCANPAILGTTVTVFVNGMGAAAQGIASGKVSTSPGSAMNVPVTVTGAGSLVSAESVPGTINGVWEVRVRMLTADLQSHSNVSPSRLTLTVAGTTAVDSILVWTIPPQ